MRTVRLGLCLAVSVLSLLPLAPAAPPAVAQSTCTNTTLSGNYAYSFSGHAYLGADGTPRPGGTPVEILAVGVITFDGQGAFTGADTESTGGVIRPRSYSGSYTVNADCTGISTIDPPVGPAHTFMAIDQGGDEFYVIVTDPGAAISGVAHRQ